jgi:hypothetical protein
MSEAREALSKAQEEKNKNRLNQASESISENEDSKKPRKKISLDNDTWRNHTLVYYDFRRTEDEVLAKLRWYCNEILKEPQIRRSFSEKWQTFGADHFVSRDLSPDHPEVRDA